MFIVIPIPRARQAPEERHETSQSPTKPALPHMPLLRSLAELAEAPYYKHGAPDGACRCLEPFRTRLALGQTCKVPRIRSRRRGKVRLRIPSVLKMGVRCSEDGRTPPRHD
jgi:hypothetical protein